MQRVDGVPLSDEHIKPRLLGHWGTTPGLNLLCAHLNRVIGQRDRDVLFVTGPGHGGPALVANTWLEGSWTAAYPNTTRDEVRMARLLKQSGQTRTPSGNWSTGSAATVPRNSSTTRDDRCRTFWNSLLSGGWGRARRRTAAC
ncbi:phosphoketolase [Kribbella aluminosa]|uniref:Phosphoketolase n=1 Tax=Kribbella aluminosa TaxID=416017 RepID=A0ABS4UNF4_9ACTN|nr:phosphoketolase [Kribbella aluminosa]